jgi:hypothetical protein
MSNKSTKQKGGKIELKQINLTSKYFLAKNLISTKHGGGGKTETGVIDYNIVLTDPEVFDILAEHEEITIEMITISYKDEILFNGRVETMYIDIFINDIKYENIRLVKNKNKSGTAIIHKTFHKFIMSANILSSNSKLISSLSVEEEEETEYLIEEVENVQQKGGISSLKQRMQMGGEVIKELGQKCSPNKNKIVGYVFDAAWIATGLATAYYILKK